MLTNLGCPTVVIHSDDSVTLKESSHLIPSGDSPMEEISDPIPSNVSPMEESNHPIPDDNITSLLRSVGVMTLEST